MIKLGVIGLGQRGYGLIKDTIIPQGEFKITAVSDVYEDRRNQAVKTVMEMTGEEPKAYAEYLDLINDPEVGAVIIASGWEYHVEMACAAMEAGKWTAFEVGGAYSIDDCRKLIETYEETGTPCSMLENTCYGREELLVLNMVRQGLFGTVVHCAGGYRHCLLEEISFGRENRHYRFMNYLNRNCDNYPTHDLGPAANILNINHGNRMVSLVSVASKSAGLHEYILEKQGEQYDAASMTFAQGDVINTIIKCENGETILLTLDTTLPRYYSRGFHVQGTKAMYEEDNKSLFMAGANDSEEDEFHWDKNWGNIKEYYEKYDHPIWKNMPEGGIPGGHDGIDYFEFCAVARAIRENRMGPVDIYDAVTWMSVSALSEESIKKGGAPVEFPDFTNGKWKTRPLWEA